MEIKSKKKRAKPRKKLKKMLVYLLTLLMIFSVAFTESYSSQALDKPGGQGEEALGVIAEPATENEASSIAFNSVNLEEVAEDNNMGQQAEETAVELQVEAEKQGQAESLSMDNSEENLVTEEQGEDDTLITERSKENPPAEEEAQEELSNETPEKNEDQIEEEAETATEEQQMISPMAEGDRVVTADTSKLLKINLFDYTTDNNEGSGNVGINSGHALKFAPGGLGSEGREFNRYTQSSKTFPGIVQGLLDGGFPRLSYSVTNSTESLGYLFNSAPISNAKIPYLGMNKLFLYDSNSRYYSFDSTKYFAQANTDADPTNPGYRTFTVYEDAQSKGFFPFNNYGNMAQLSTQPRGANHYFGLHVRGQFVQPVDGKITRKDGIQENMIFNFSGDDDLWVFIDGVLILDIGGIHQASSGSINFSTGEVVVSNQEYNKVTTNIKQLFANAGKGLSGRGNTFNDNTLHSIDVFYLERGNYDSNLKIQFNLDLIETGSIIVRKELKTESGATINSSAATDVDYEFTLYKRPEQENEEPAALNNVSYIHKNKAGVQSTKNTGASGKFTLKAGEEARFSGMATYAKYFVVESGISSRDYSGVTFTLNNEGPVRKVISNEGIVTSDNITLTNEQSIIQLICTNILSKDNIMSLEIIKKLQSDSKAAEYAYGNNSFQIQVSIGGELYRNGPYTLFKTSGDGSVGEHYTTDNNGVLILKPKDRVEITGLVGGSSYKVKEIGGDDFDKFSISYVITGGKNPSTNDDGASGNLNTFSDASNVKRVAVTIKNKPLESTITINKIDSITGLKLQGAKFKVYGDEALTKELITVESQKDSSTRIIGLIVGKVYYLREIAPDGYQENNNVYKLEIYNVSRWTITPGSIVNGKWAASGDGRTLTGDEEYIIENHRLSSVRLIKKDNNGGYLAGVTFRLEKLRTDGTVEGSHVDKITDASGLVEFYNLLPGRYRITEIATVPGYNLLTEPIEISLPWSTQEEAEEGANIRPYAQIQDDGETTYYYDEVEYIITNSPNFTVPTTGGSNYYYGGLGGLLIIALALGGIIYRKKAIRRAN